MAANEDKIIYRRIRGRVVPIKVKRGPGRPKGSGARPKLDTGPKRLPGRPVGSGVRPKMVVPKRAVGRPKGSRNKQPQFTVRERITKAGVGTALGAASAATIRAEGLLVRGISREIKRTTRKGETLAKTINTRGHNRLEVLKEVVPVETAHVKRTIRKEPMRVKRILAAQKQKFGRTFPAAAKARASIQTMRSKEFLGAVSHDQKLIPQNTLTRIKKVSKLTRRKVKGLEHTSKAGGKALSGGAGLITYAGAKNLYQAVTGRGTTNYEDEAIGALFGIGVAKFGFSHPSKRAVTKAHRSYMKREMKIKRLLPKGLRKKAKGLYKASQQPTGKKVLRHLKKLKYLR